ncbi:MAG: hypothetical protein HYW79_04130 [Parcubacteria group bacterium]|nr:hypothetical protein [Parcubacteria group bacterium]
MADGQQNKDLVLAPGEFAYVLETSKGTVITYVGPNVQGMGANQVPVVWDNNGRKFTHSDLTAAKQQFVNVPEGSYVVLEAPASGPNVHPSEGSNNTNMPELNFGRRINVPGPAQFALWPRQFARVLPGHQLRSNEFLVARVYNDEQAIANWDAAVMRPQTLPVSGEEQQVQRQVISRGITRPDHLTVGQLLIIKGTDVSFYIPPTGIEVISDNNSYVRRAVTLERLEFCVLLGEDGNKRFVTGPDVVFPKPTETFVDVGGEVKFKAIELTPISGIYVKVIADYQDTDGDHKAGDELFITGKDQAIYYPRPEHSLIEYDGRKIHHAIALPEGEGRYVLDRISGDIKLVNGPKMLLSDPRSKVVVRRILGQNAVKLIYPNNAQALKINAELEAISREIPAGEYFTKEAADRVLLRSPAVKDTVTTSNFAAESFQRGTRYTPPRTITLDTKYDGAVRVDIWTGYAVLITDSTGNRRVVVGPQTILLEYDENLASMELSTGTPKDTKEKISTVYLRVLNNRVSDKVIVETSDLCKVALTLSYRVNFEGDDHERWFAVENYVKFLTDHLRSLIRNIGRQHGVEKFYRDAINIVRDAVLGVQQDGHRSGRSFNENGMRIYDVEVLDVKVENAEIDRMLVGAQHKAFEATLKVAEAERELGNTKRIELARRGTIKERATTIKLEKKVETMAVADTLGVNIAKIEADAESQKERNKSDIAKQQALDKISKAEIAREKRVRDEELRVARVVIEQALARIKGETDEFVRRTVAVSPEMIVALQAFGDKDLVEKAAKAMAPLAILGGTSIIDVLNKLLEGTPLKAVVESLGTRDGSQQRVTERSTLR